MLPPRQVTDAPILNAVDEEKIKQSLQGDNAVRQLIADAAKLVEDTNKPNVITVAQFMPYVPMFNMDVERYKTDRDYQLQMNRMYNSYIHDLGINLYEITIVIESEDNPVEVVALNRKFTRIADDAVKGVSMRNTIPAVNRSADTTRDQEVLKASVSDLVAANGTEEQKAFFRRVKMESALVERRFVEKNMSPEKRDEIMNGGKQAQPTDEPVADTGETSEGATVPGDAGRVTQFLDDDDD